MKKQSDSMISHNYNVNGIVLRPICAFIITVSLFYVQHVWADFPHTDSINALISSFDIHDVATSSDIFRG